MFKSVNTADVFYSQYYYYGERFIYVIFNFLLNLRYFYYFFRIHGVEAAHNFLEKISLRELYNRIIYFNELIIAFVKV
jgi:hypothetical protein